MIDRLPLLRLSFLLGALAMEAQTIPSASAKETAAPELSWSINDRGRDLSLVYGAANSDVVDRTSFECPDKAGQVEMRIGVSDDLLGAVLDLIRSNDYPHVELLAGEHVAGGMFDTLFFAELGSVWTIKVTPLEPEALWPEIARTRSLSVVVGGHRENLFSSIDGIEQITAFAERCAASKKVSR